MPERLMSCCELMAQTSKNLVEMTTEGDISCSRAITPWSGGNSFSQRAVVGRSCAVFPGAVQDMLLFRLSHLTFFFYLLIHTKHFQMKTVEVHRVLSTLYSFVVSGK